MCYFLLHFFNKINVVSSLVICDDLRVPFLIINYQSHHLCVVSMSVTIILMIETVYGYNM